MRTCSKHLAEIKRENVELCCMQWRTDSTDHVERRMYCFHASLPDSRPPPVCFSPPGNTSAFKNIINLLPFAPTPLSSLFIHTGTKVSTTTFNPLNGSIFTMVSCPFCLVLMCVKQVAGCNQLPLNTVVRKENLQLAKCAFNVWWRIIVCINHSMWMLVLVWRSVFFCITELFWYVSFE